MARYVGVSGIFGSLLCLDVLCLFLVLPTVQLLSDLLDSICFFEQLMSLRQILSLECTSAVLVLIHNLDINSPFLVSFAHLLLFGFLLLVAIGQLFSFTAAGTLVALPGSFFVVVPS